MPKIFSGIQPTNNLHLGNYLGAIKNWLELQVSNECLFCVVDLHALTVYQEPKLLRQNILTVAKSYLALGLDPKKSSIFVQSEVVEHTELAWILNTIAKIGELERMTQYKDKAKQHNDNINLGLFAYPVLMAADILLYDTEVVPVGEDQKQHVELARDLAERFNKLYGKTFVVPKPMIKKDGARIMGLDDPVKKMSKSASNPNNYISLLDPIEVTTKKIKRAVTDSGSLVKSGTDKPALTNLIGIYSLLSGDSVKAVEKKYEGAGYGDFKNGLVEVVTDFVKDFQYKFKNISDKEVVNILQDGAERARNVATKKMVVVKKMVGVVYN